MTPERHMTNKHERRLLFDDIGIDHRSLAIQFCMTLGLPFWIYVQFVRAAITTGIQLESNDVHIKKLLHVKG